jgi:hypothetical protein
MVSRAKRGGPVSIPRKSVEDFWWTKWQWEHFFPMHFDIPLSGYSIIIFITVLLLPEEQARKAMERTNKSNKSLFRIGTAVAL